MAIQISSVCALIQVFDMPTSLAFYREKLGFEVVSAAPAGDSTEWCLLKHGGARLMLNAAYEAPERPNAPDPARIAAHDDTGLFFECASADGVFAELSGQGLSIDPPTTAPYGMRQLYLRDPDGYQLCFQHRA